MENENSNDMIKRLSYVLASPQVRFGDRALGVGMLITPDYVETRLTQFGFVGDNVLSDETKAKIMKTTSDITNYSYFQTKFSVLNSISVMENKLTQLGFINTLELDDSMKVSISSSNRHLSDEQIRLQVKSTLQRYGYFPPDDIERAVNDCRYYHKQSVDITDTNDEMKQTIMELSLDKRGMLCNIETGSLMEVDPYFMEHRTFGKTMLRRHLMSIGYSEKDNKPVAISVIIFGKRNDAEQLLYDELFPNNECEKDDVTFKSLWEGLQSLQITNNQV